jgi:Adenylyl/Guanylyl and SMODS C-terminal sensor domain
MYSDFDKKTLGDLLQKLAETIDLTDSQYEKAEIRYKRVGEFLCEKGTLLAMYDPHVLVQGSIRIGTTTRPLLENEGFDVDLTGVLQNYPHPAQQKTVKELFEKRLRQDSNYNRMLNEDEEKRRCWRLPYADEPKFHLDIVPALKDNYDWLLAQNVEERFAKHAITITDNEHKDYHKELYQKDLPKSNTEGYALWFLDVMKVEGDSIREFLKKEYAKMGKVEDVPEYKVRTPLQRGVQLMKRHRDIRYSGKNVSDFKPVSIVITTLAALAYQKVMRSSPSNLFYDIIRQMVEEMPSFIKYENGKYEILNPVDPKENFADKWNEPKTRYYASTFTEWHQLFKKDLEESFSKRKDIQESVEILKGQFGNRDVNAAVTLMEAKQPRTFLEMILPKNTALIAKQKPLWEMDLQSPLKISASYKTVLGRTFIDLDNQTLPKNANVRFAVKSTIQPPYEVYWQITNSGREAEAANCLRGNILHSKTLGIGGMEHTEQTLYVGEHAVECYIVKDAKCVARSGDFPVKIGN